MRVKSMITYFHIDRLSFYKFFILKLNVKLHTSSYKYVLYYMKKLPQAPAQPTHCLKLMFSIPKCL
jgi:hypothetical protein